MTNLRFRVQYCRRSNGLSYCGIIQASRQDGMMVENSYGPKGGIWGRYFSTGVTLASRSKIFCSPLCSDVIVHFFCTSFFYPWNVGKSFFKIGLLKGTNGLGIYSSKNWFWALVWIWSPVCWSICLFVHYFSWKRRGSMVITSRRTDHQHEFIP